MSISNLASSCASEGQRGAKWWNESCALRLQGYWQKQGSQGPGSRLRFRIQPVRGLLCFYQQAGTYTQGAPATNAEPQ